LIDVPGDPGKGVASVVSGELAGADGSGTSVEPVEPVEPVVESVDPVDGGAADDDGTLVDAGAVGPGTRACSVVTPAVEVHAATSAAATTNPATRARRRRRGDMARMVRDVSVELAS
jgi:hypothetical protein